MAMAVETLDRISREKQRDVLYITFHDPKCDWSPDPDWIRGEFDWEHNEKREQVIGFLEKHNIAYEACFPAQPTNGMLVISCCYLGEIYVDVEYDESNETYQLLNHYLEDEHGKPRMQNVKFWHYTLELAMKNAEHDEPDFWDNM